MWFHFLLLTVLCLIIQVSAKYSHFLAPPTGVGLQLPCTQVVRNGAMSMEMKFSLTHAHSFGILLKLSDLNSTCYYNMTVEQDEERMMELRNADISIFASHFCRKLLFSVCSEKPINIDFFLKTVRYNDSALESVTVIPKISDPAAIMRSSQGGKFSHLDYRRPPKNFVHNDIMQAINNRNYLRLAELADSSGSSFNSLDEYGDSPLSNCARRNDPTCLKIILTIPDVDADHSKSIFKKTRFCPIEVAIQYGSLDAVETFMHILGPNYCHRNGTVLHHLVRSPWPVQVVSSFVAKFPDLDPNDISCQKLSPAALAVSLNNTEIALWVMHSPIMADPYLPGSIAYRSTCLHIACARGDLPLVEDILGLNPKITWYDIPRVQNFSFDQSLEPWSPLSMAVRAKHWDIVKLFVRNYGANNIYDDGMTLLHYAIRYKCLSAMFGYPSDKRDKSNAKDSVVASFVQVHSSNGVMYSPVGYCLVVGDFNCVLYFSSVFSVKLSGFEQASKKSYLYLACRFSDRSVVSYILSNFFPLVDEVRYDSLLEDAINVSLEYFRPSIIKAIYNHFGRQHLFRSGHGLVHLACIMDKIEVIKYLAHCDPTCLTLKTSSSSKVYPGYTVPELAAVMGRIEILNFFLVLAHPNVSIDFGKMLSQAVKGKKLKTLQLLFARFREKRSAMELMRFEDTGLEYAVRKGYSDMAMEFVKFFGISWRYDNGQSVFHYLAKYDRFELLQKLEEIIPEDIESEFIYADSEGMTPVHYAVMKNCTNIVTRFLRALSVSMKLSQAEGISPLQLAVKNDLENIVFQFIERFGVNQYYGKERFAVIHMIAMEGNEKMLISVREKYPNIKLSLLSGEFLMGWNAMGLAVLHKHHKMIVKFTQPGLEVSALKASGTFRSVIAAAFESGSTSILELVIRLMLNSNYMTRSNPSHSLSDIDVFFQAELMTSAKYCVGKIRFATVFLDIFGPNHQYGEGGHTLLHLAADSGDFELVKLHYKYPDTNPDLLYRFPLVFGSNKYFQVNHHRGGADYAENAFSDLQAKLPLSEEIFCPLSALGIAISRDRLSIIHELVDGHFKLNLSLIADGCNRTAVELCEKYGSAMTKRHIIEPMLKRENPELIPVPSNETQQSSNTSADAAATDSNDENNAAESSEGSPSTEPESDSNLGATFNFLIISLACCLTFLIIVFFILKIYNGKGYLLATSDTAL